MRILKPNLVLIGLFFTSIFSAVGQSINYEISLIALKKNPVSGIPVYFEETSTKDTVLRISNAAGKAKFVINHGAQWTLNIGELKNIKTCTMPASGTMTGSQTFPYVPDLYANRNDKPDRTGINFTTIKQENIQHTPAYKSKQVAFTVWLQNSKNQNQSNIPVSVVDIVNKKIYTNTTKSNGKAYFLLPGGPKYYIDVDGNEYLENSETKDEPYGYETVIKVKYERSKVIETLRNDTILQKLPSQLNDNTGYSRVQIKVNRDGKACGNLMVWLEQLSTGKIYESQTNSTGITNFQLPIGHEYMIHFKYQPDVDVLRLDNRFSNSSTVNFTFTYQPIPRLISPGTFIPRPDDLFLKNFEQFVNNQWPEPKEGRAVEVFFNWGNANINANAKEAVMEFRIVGAADDPAKTKANETSPINLYLVLDISGSMAGDRINALKTAVLKLKQGMREKDQISIIVFNELAELSISHFPAKSSKMDEVINSLLAGGGTSIYNGLELAQKTINQHNSPNIKRLILLTDGYGSHPPAEVVALAKKIVNKQVPIAPIGVGQYYNFSLLQLIAELSQENVHQVFQSEEMESVLNLEALHIAKPMATNFQLSIKFNNKVVLSTIYGPAYTEQANSCEINLPVIYPSMKHIAIGVFKLPKPDKTIENEPIILQYSFTNSVGLRENYEKKALLTWNESSGTYELIRSAEEKQLYAIAILNQSIKVMADNYAANNYGVALDAVNKCMEQIEELYPEAKEKEVKELYDSLKIYSAGLRKLMRG